MEFLSSEELKDACSHFIATQKPFQATTPDQVRTASLRYAKYMLCSMKPRSLEKASGKVKKISEEAIEGSSEMALAAHRLRAQKGDAASCLHLGLCTLFGLGTRFVVPLAWGLFQQARNFAAQSTPPDREMASIASALLLGSFCLTPHAGLPYDGLDRQTVETGFAIAADSVNFIDGEAIPDFVYTFSDHWESKIKTWPEYQARTTGWGSPVLWKLLHEKRRELKMETERLARKMSVKPNRYRCAALGCTIATESGKALKRCGGKCPEHSKPHYCSSECQKKDWPRHKSSCRPDAPPVPPNASPLKDADYDIEIFCQGVNKSGADIIRTVPSTSGKQYRIKGSREGVMRIVLIDDSKGKGNFSFVRA